MSMFSLGTIIDDILLIVRNNNISESEDFSRAQIAAWVMHYKALLTKQKLDEEDDELAENDDIRDSFAKVAGPLKLVDKKSADCTPLFAKLTEKGLSDLLDDNPNYIISVFDQSHCPIQYMHGLRRHFHYFRKYTGGNLTWCIDPNENKIEVNGYEDCNQLRYIYVKYISSGKTEDGDYDEEQDIPGWMIPQIKELIFKNELSFMIKMPSDDDNNSTLDGIKPHGPQDQEK